MTDYKLKHCKVNKPPKDKKQFFAVSDIHGHINEFKLLLTAWNPEEQTLVLLGDYVDRGQYSKTVLDEIIKLKEQYKDKVIVLLGNHDEALIDTIIDYQKSPFHVDLSITDSSTLYQIVDSNNVSKYVEFIRSMKLYHQYGKLLFTHAGYNTQISDWRNTSKYDFLWIRGHYCNSNKFDLINIFGHTPGITIPGHRRPEIMTEHNGFIAIDGGVFSNGRLNGIVIDEEGTLLDYYYARDFNRHEESLAVGNTFEFED